MSLDQSHYRRQCSKSISKCNVKCKLLFCQCLMLCQHYLCKCLCNISANPYTSINKQMLLLQLVNGQTTTRHHTKCKLLVLGIFEKKLQLTSVVCFKVLDMAKLPVSLTTGEQSIFFLNPSRQDNSAGHNKSTQ